MTRTVAAVLATLALLLAACSTAAEPAPPLAEPTSATPVAQPAAATPGSATPATGAGTAAGALTGAPVPQLATAAADFDAGLLNSSAGRFPPLDDPVVVSAAEATWLESETLILGAVQNGEARAYPLSMMRFHHVANDVLGGEPYLVTF